jgi:hypothetical protein
LRGVLGRTATALAGHDVAVVDSATAMAEVAHRLLGASDPADNRRTQAGELHCYATDTSRLEELAPRFLGEPLSRFELVDL